MESNNVALMANPTFENVWKTIFSMDPNSAPKPNGFNDFSLRKKGDTTGKEVQLAVSDFFVTGKLCWNRIAIF